MERSFPLAPMNGVIRVLTYGLLGLGLVFLALGLKAPVVGGPLFLSSAGILVLSVEVWLLHRPRDFTVRPGALALNYPLRTKRVALAGLSAAEVLTAADLRARFGWALRVGVGGLFGGFGWLYTSKGWVEMDIARTDGLVLLTFAGRMPLLVTPDEPQAFVDAVREAAPRANSS